MCRICGALVLWNRCDRGKDGEKGYPYVISQVTKAGIICVSVWPPGKARPQSFPFGLSKNGWATIVRYESDTTEEKTAKCFDAKLGSTTLSIIFSI